MRRVSVFVVLLVLLAGCSDDGDKDGQANDDKTSVEQGRELATVKPGKLTVCIKAPNAPFAFDEGGELRGIDADMAKAAAGRLGLAADMVRSTDVLADLRAGKCDAASSVDGVADLRGLERTAPYFEVHEVLLVRQGDEAKYNGFPALKGKPVGFPRTPAALVYATDFGRDVVLREHPTQNEAIAALTARQVEAVVVDQAVALHAITTGGELAVGAVLDPEEAIDDYAFAVPTGKPALKQAVETALGQVRGDDTYRTILTNYLGSAAGQA